MADSTWSFGPHSEPKQLSDNLWTVTAVVPKMGGMVRRMMVVRGQGGGLLVHSAIAMDEAGMAWLDSLGPVEVIVVPNGWHRMDAPRYKARYPEARVICPRGSTKRVRQVVPVDGHYGEIGPFPNDPSVSMAHHPGLREIEGVIKVQSEDGLTAIFNDALFNIDHMPGFFGFVYGKLMGNAGGPRITTIARLFMVQDRSAYRRHLEAISDQPRLMRVVPGHGAIIDDNPTAMLREVAASL